jgi:hypothetical protein
MNSPRSPLTGLPSGGSFGDVLRDRQMLCNRPPSRRYNPHPFFCMRASDRFESCRGYHTIRFMTFSRGA